MNRLFILLPAATLLTGLVLIATRPFDILTDTGVTKNDIQEGALTNLTDDSYFNFGSTSAMRSMARRIPEGSRATAVRMLGKAVRAYIESAEFKNTYRESLKARYSVDETYNDASIARRKQEIDGADDVADQYKASLSQSFAALDPAMLQNMIRMSVQQQEAELATLNAGERSQKAQEIAAVKKILAATAGKPAEFKKQYLAYLNGQVQQSLSKNTAQAQTDLAQAKERNADYHKQKAILDAHADVKPLLKQRLQNFVALCNDVDFDAKLAGTGSRREFVNPAYQRKPAEWKFLYRLGKEPVTEAKAFAQQWLSELR